MTARARVTFGRSRGEVVEAGDQDSGDQLRKNVRGNNGLHTSLISVCSSIAIAPTSLGQTSFMSVIESLDARKAKLADSVDGDWSLRCLEACLCEVTDQGLGALLAYAARNENLRSVRLSQNLIELSLHPIAMISSINASRLVSLDLSGNKFLSSSGASYLFTLLNAPHLTSLDLSFCDLVSEVAKPIAEYLHSRRSRNLRRLELRGNHLDVPATREIIDALEFGSYTLRSLSIISEVWLRTTPSPTNLTWHSRVLPFPSRELQAECTRVAPLLERNNILVKRTRTAALRCLPFAHILLNAEPRSERKYSSLLRRLRLTHVHPPTPNFLDLPSEIRHQIIRHTSMDAGALSEAQFLRLMRSAEGKGGIQRALGTRQAASRALGAVQLSGIAVSHEKTLANAWLRAEGLSWWETGP